MRLWSIHPQYLDAKGLIAVWREGLLAQAALAGKTTAYKNHPQLERFKQHPNPTAAIATYLEVVWHEAKNRGYAFSKQKIGKQRTKEKILISSGQLGHEFRHLLNKLKQRDPSKYAELQLIPTPQPHPIMEVVTGGVASWEKL